MLLILFFYCETVMYMTALRRTQPNFRESNHIAGNEPSIKRALIYQHIPGASGPYEFMLQQCGYELILPTVISSVDNPHVQTLNWGNIRPDLVIYDIPDPIQTTYQRFISKDRERLIGSRILLTTSNFDQLRALVSPDDPDIEFLPDPIALSDMEKIFSGQDHKRFYEEFVHDHEISPRYYPRSIEAH